MNLKTGFQSKKNRKYLYIHIFVWTIYWLTEYIFTSIVYETSPEIVSYLTNLFFCVLYFYFIVNFAQKPISNKYNIQTFFILLTIMMIFIIVKSFFEFYVLNEYIEKSKIPSKFGLEFWRFTTISFYSIAYLIYLRSIVDQKKILATEKKLLLTEIAFLKAQINPHFLFNTLNFVYNDISLISPVGGDVILKLSEMLRYAVDSTKQDLVVISKEAEAIERYISLQKTRFENKVFINFNPKGDLKKHKLPPLILLSIVENAFKYGILYDENKYIEVVLKVINNELYFECSNIIRQDFKDKETNAIGLGNIRRRLEIVYKNKFELTHFVDDNRFVVLLRIFY